MRVSPRPHFFWKQRSAVSLWIQKSLRIYVSPRTGPQSAHHCSGRRSYSNVTVYDGHKISK